jgi:hypothetical protein
VPQILQVFTTRASYNVTHVGLIRIRGLVIGLSLTKEVSLAQLALVSAAIQKQISRDSGPLWNVETTVEAFDNLEDVPIGYWHVLLQEELPNGAAGLHKRDDNKQPFALVALTNNWPVFMSHEVLEMLVDPLGTLTRGRLAQIRPRAGGVVVPENLICADWRHETESAHHSTLHLLATFVADMVKSRRRLEAENLFLRHQLNIALRRTPPRPRLRGSDRALLVWITRIWPMIRFHRHHASSVRIAS